MNATRPALRPAAIALLIIALLAAAILPAAAQRGPATTPEPLAPPPTLVPTATPFQPTVPPPDSPTAIPPAVTPTASPFIMPAIEFVGIVDAVGPGTITVNGQVINTSAAGIRGTPAVGDPVKVEGFVGDFGQIMAREVQVIDLAQSGLRPGEIELIGLLTGMTQNRLTIAGFPMDAANAEFGPGVGLGQLVKVHATLDAQNQWVIREIELASEADVLSSTTRPAGEFEITGTLTEAGPGYIVVNGLPISTANAGIKGALVPGSLVKVHLSYVNGQWVAREVEPASSVDQSGGNPAGEFEIYGVISELGSGYIVVNGQRISIANAEIKDPLAAGALVKVHLSNVNGEWVAREVELAGGADDSGADDHSGSGSGTSGSDGHGGSSGSDDSGSDDHGGDDHSGSDDHGGDSHND